MAATAKQQLHDLVDRLDDADAGVILDLARRLLERSTPPAPSTAISDAAHDPEELIAEHIAPDSRGPAEARLADHGVRVWAVIGSLRANAGDISAAAADYDLPPEAMAAALAYYDRHRAAIDARLALNAATLAATS
jgi:uncharacterized protein (DUF433 family)